MNGMMMMDPTSGRRNEEEEEEEEDRNGLKLLAKHLAQVKLEAEERNYANRELIKKLEARVTTLAEALEESLASNEKAKARIKQLEREMTQKFRIQERDDWIALNASLRQDKLDLQNKCNELKSKIDQLESANESRIAVPAQLVMSEREEEEEEEEGDDDDSIKKKEDIIMVTPSERQTLDEMNLVQKLRQQLEEKDAEIAALREKLDFELELKWNRTHESLSATTTTSDTLLLPSQSLLESIVETVAPYSQQQHQQYNESRVSNGEEEEEEGGEE